MYQEIKGATWPVSKILRRLERATSFGFRVDRGPGGDWDGGAGLTVPSMFSVRQLSFKGDPRGMVSARAEAFRLLAREFEKRQFRDTLVLCKRTGEFILHSNPQAFYRTDPSGGISFEVCLPLRTRWNVT